MVAFDRQPIAVGWASAKWLLWIGLYLTLGIFMPWVMTRAWAHLHHSNMRPRPGQLFRQGELGLVSLVLAISVIWDLQKSQYMPTTIALGSVLLSMTGIMAVSVWIETYCRRATGTDFSPERAWRDSRSLTLLVFSLSMVSEILLDRFVKVTAP